MAIYGASFTERLRALGERARALRLIRRLSQGEVATRAGVALNTVHRFEKTGMASIESVIRIASALNADEAFDKLFEAPPYKSIDDALSRAAATARARAPRRR